MLTERQEELLVVVMEECSEVQKECAKVLRFDDDPKQRISHEIGDLLCVIEMLSEADLIDSQLVNIAREGKRHRLRQWMRHNED